MRRSLGKGFAYAIILLLVPLWALTTDAPPGHPDDASVVILALAVLAYFVGSAVDKFRIEVRRRQAERRNREGS